MRQQCFFFLFNAIIKKGHGYSSYIPCTLGNKKLIVVEGKDIYIQQGYTKNFKSSLDI
jgi:hypothetical protein